MVDISAKKRTETSKRKPIWLLACYALFIFACLNIVRTYQEQKALVQSKLEENDEDTEEIQYSAGAEEHVVTSYGSSQYGGSMKAVSGKKKKKKRVAIFAGVRPEPSDGSKDYMVNHSPSDFKGFSFYVMTDTPQTELEEKRLRSQMAELRDYTKSNPERNITLGLHLGGTQKFTQCTESVYESHAKLIAKGPRPTFVTPGKSDWFDCPRREEAFDFFLKHLGSDFVSQWHTYQFENFDIRRSEKNPELFSLYIEGILFIGLHVIDPPANQESTSTRDKRMVDSMNWFAKSIEGNFAEREVRGVIIMGHAGRSERNQKFFARMRKYFDASTRQDIPVLYLHGDGLAWKLDNHSPYYDIQLDRGGLAEPCIIDVAAQQKGKMQSLHLDRDTGDQKVGMQSILGKGLFRFDQQGGRHVDPEKIP